MLGSVCPADITPGQPGVARLHPSSVFALHWDVCVSRCCPELPNGVALELSRAALDLVTRPMVAASLPVSLPPPLLVFPGITLQMKPMRLCLGSALRD